MTNELKNLSTDFVYLKLKSLFLVNDFFVSLFRFINLIRDYNFILGLLICFFLVEFLQLQNIFYA